jgi:hypothetical protein
MSVWICVLDWTDLNRVEGRSFCEHGYESSFCIKMENFLTRWSTIKFSINILHLEFNYCDFGPHIFNYSIRNDVSYFVSSVHPQTLCGARTICPQNAFLAEKYSQNPKILESKTKSRRYALSIRQSGVSVVLMVTVVFITHLNSNKIVSILSELCIQAIFPCRGRWKEYVPFKISIEIQRRNFTRFHIKPKSTLGNRIMISRKSTDRILNDIKSHNPFTFSLHSCLLLIWNYSEALIFITSYEGRLKSSWTGGSAPLLCRGRRWL